MDEDELKKLEAQYLGSTLLPNSMADFDINSYLQQIDSSPSKHDGVEGNKNLTGFQSLDLDSFKLGADFNLESIDKMLEELDIPTSEFSKQKQPEGTLASYASELLGSLKMVSDTEEKKGEKDDEDLISDFEDHKGTDNQAMQYLQIEVTKVSHKNSEASIDKRSDNSGSDSRKNSHVDFTPSASSRKIGVPTPTHEMSPLLSRQSNKTVKDPYHLGLEDNPELRKKSSDIKISKIEDLPFSRKKEEKAKSPGPVENEVWLEEIAKKIRYGEVEFIYEKSKIDLLKVRAMAEGKNSPVRTRGVITLDKPKEFRLGEENQATFKLAMSKFDQTETKAIREIKKRRDSHLFSALDNVVYDISSMSSVVFDKSLSLQDLIKNNVTGSLTCYAFSQDGTSMFAAGTENGDIIEIDLFTKKIRKHNVGVRVLSIDISPDKEKFIAGLSNGEVYIKKTNGAWASKKLQLEQRGIVIVTFITNELAVISTDKTTLKLVIKDLKLMIDVTKTYVLQDSKDNIAQIAVKYIDKDFKIIVSTLTSIHLFSITPDITTHLCSLDKPEYVKEGAVPHVSWISVEETASHYAIVFWSNFALLMKVEGENSFFGGMKQLTQTIVWGCVIRSRVVCLLFEDMEVHFESIQNVFANLISGGGFETKFKLTKPEYSSRAETSASTLTAASARLGAAW